MYTKSLKDRISMKLRNVDYKLDERKLQYQK